MRQIVILSFITLSFISCRHITGSGNIITEKRQVADFTGISAGGAFEVEVKNGPKAVEVQADDNLIKYIRTRVDGDKLEIAFSHSLNLTDAHLKIYVTAPGINYLQGSGAANIKVIDGLKSTGKIALDASGAANIDAVVDAPKVETESSGAANIYVKGRTRDLRATASGAGNVKAKELLSETTYAESSGAGTVHVYASVHLNAHASGAGNVFYSGDASVESNTSGAGNVKKEE